MGDTAYSTECKCVETGEMVKMGVNYPSPYVAVGCFKLTPKKLQNMFIHFLDEEKKTPLGRVKWHEDGVIIPVKGKDYVFTWEDSNRLRREVVRLYPHVYY